jgi:hypothetical protein
MGEEEKTVRFELRLPASLRQRIEEQAANNRRSLNSEITDRLSKSFDEARQQIVETERRLIDRVQELEFRVAEISKYSQGFQGGMVMYVPQEIVDLLAKTTKGGGLAIDLYDEAIRRIGKVEERRDEGDEGN